MREFKKVNKMFIKSNNTTTKIFNRFLYCLIPFFVLIILYNIIWGSLEEVLNLAKSTSISLLTSFFVQYIFNLKNNEKDFAKILIKDHILTISLILGLFAINSPIIITIASSVLSIIMKNVLKNTTYSSSLYGILLILIVSCFVYNIDTPLNNLRELKYIGSYNDIIKPYGTILTYGLGLKYYISPLIAILSFIYLFYNKSIKYNIVISYLLTLIFTMLLFGLFNNMNIWYLFLQLTTGNVLFLSVFCLTDYKNTPTIGEGQIIYGVILGLLTCILRFIIPELSVVIPLILGPILLTKVLDEISFKLKYNKKFYYTIISILLILIVLTNVIINIII